MKSGRWDWLKQKVFALTAVFVAPLAALWHIGTHPALLSPIENAERARLTDFHTLSADLFELPLVFLRFGLKHLVRNDILAIRLSSVIFLVILSAGIYILFKSFFGYFIATLSTLLFSFSGWVLTSARNGSYFVTLLSPILLMAAFSRFVRLKSSGSWLTLCALAGICIYFPGVIWLLLIGAIFGYKIAKSSLETVPRAAIWSGAILFLAFLAPWVAYHQGLHGVLLIPHSLPSILIFIKSLGWAVIGLFWHTNVHYELGVGKLPLLNILEVALAVIGFYALFSKHRRISLFLISYGAVFSLLAALSQSSLIMLGAVPALIVFAAAGLRYLYVEWQRIFPRNPIPRVMAFSLIIAAVMVSVLYGARYALVAWPHTDETHKLYMIK